MNRIVSLENSFRGCVNEQPACNQYFLSQIDKWNRLTVAMDTLGDTALALSNFEKSGFGRDLLGEAYLRFYGTLQAIILQQDAISELHLLIFDQSLQIDELSAWQSLRTFRNTAAGHPLDKRTKEPAGELRTSH